MEQIELLRRVVGILEGLRIRYILFGSMASSAYGEPRMTRDIDIVGILKVSGQLIDGDYLERWSAMLGLLEIWRRIQERIAGR